MEGRGRRTRPPPAETVFWRRPYWPNWRRPVGPVWAAARGRPEGGLPEVFRLEESRAGKVFWQDDDGRIEDGKVLNFKSFVQNGRRIESFENKFGNVGGDWKMTNESEDLESGEKLMRS